MTQAHNDILYFAYDHGIEIAYNIKVKPQNVPSNSACPSSPPHKHIPFLISEIFERF